MKKITLVLILTALSFIGFSQSNVPQPVKVTSGTVTIGGGTVALNATDRAIADSTKANTASIEAYANAINGSVKSNSVINSTGFTGISSSTIATSTGSYAAEENVGGINTVTLAVRSSGGYGALNSIDVWDISNQKATLEIHLWDASPAGTFTDNAAEVIAGDQGKYLGRILIGGADYTTTGTAAVASINNIGKLIKANGSTSIFATVKVISNAATYAANAIIIKWYFSQN